MAGPKFFLAIHQGPKCYVLPIQRLHLSRKEAKSTKFCAKRAKLQVFDGHIWPAGRMLRMPDLKYGSAPSNNLKLILTF